MSTSSIIDETPSLNSSIVDEGGTHINDIETLVKEKIFGYLKPDELQIVRSVCRSWLYLINWKFGITAVIDNRNTELIGQSPWIIEVQLVNLTRPIPPEGISFARRLKHLTMKGMVVSYNLIPLLESCIHLQSLTFDEPTIDLSSNVMRSLTPTNLVLKECLQLELICWNFTESLNTVVAILTMITFGNLKKIVLRSVHPPMLPLGALFAKVPRPITENLSPFMVLILTNLEGLEVLSVGTLIVQNNFTFVVGSGQEEGSVIQLDELHLQNLYMSWTPILDAQTHLRVFVLGHCQATQWAEIRTCITRCQELLRKVELQGRTFGVPWECDVFADCLKLDTLHLNLSLSPKRQLNMIPLNLTELAIDGPIEIAQIENIKLLINLRKLYFSSLGLNLLILFPGNPEENEENQDMISLRLFVDLIMNLISLEVLGFKDCAQDALDWSNINQWCRLVSTDIFGITFHDHLYDIHGQRVQHGLTLKIPQNFNRQEFNNITNIPEDGGAPPNQRRRGGIMNNFLRIFGIGAQ